MLRDRNCIAGLLSATVTMALLAIGGCAVPIANVAPTVPLLPDEDLQSTLVNQTFEGADRQKRGRSKWMAMRGGRGMIVQGFLTDEEFVESLPSSRLKEDSPESYVPPSDFPPPKKGEIHYYNFVITQDFEDANRLYLSGEGDAALEALDRILSNPKNDQNLRWQASHLRVLVLIMMGRYDLAEQETRRTESLEMAILGKNISGRAMRAEVRYWAGDIDGSARDAAQVMRALGGWRYPTLYLSPPLDQVDLADVNTANVRGTLFLGLTFLAKGKYREALPWLELSNQTMNDVMYVLTNPLYNLYFPGFQEMFYGRGMTAMALGTNLLILDPDSKRAASMFKHAKEYFDAMGYQVGNVLIKTFRTHAYAISGRHRAAVREAEQGVSLAENAGLLTFVWRLEMLRGESLLELGRWDEGEKALRHAQAVVDLMSGTLGTDEAKIRFGTGKEAITDNLVRVDLRKGDMQSLFKDLERGRARAFVSMLANKKIGGGRQNPLLKKIHALDAEILKVRQRKNALTSAHHAAPHRERELLEKRLTLVNLIRQQDPDLASTLSVSAIELPKVQALLGVDDLMIYAIPSEPSDSIRLLLIRRTEASVKEVSMTTEELRSSLDAFIATEDSITQVNALVEIGRGLQISQWGTVSAAYIVPSGNLHFVPWGALDLNFPVAVLPTGGWLARGAQPKASHPNLVSVGDPAFGGLFPQLPGARAEAKSVAGYYGSSPLIGIQATEMAVRQKIGDGVDVLHFATHALYDPVFPLQSALILTDGKSAAPITAEALYRDPLKARVVVLSACETGMGQVIAGDDLLGLTRSFYLGGAQSVISSLWPVADEPTRLFMETFHKESKTGSYGTAWLKARDALRQKGFPPYHYGAFLLGGSLGR